MSRIEDQCGAAAAEALGQEKYPPSRAGLRTGDDGAARKCLVDLRGAEGRRNEASFEGENGADRLHRPARAERMAKRRFQRLLHDQINFDFQQVCQVILQLDELQQAWRFIESY